MSFEVGKNVVTGVSIAAIAMVAVVMMLTDHVSVGLITAVAGAFGILGKSYSQNRE